MSRDAKQAGLDLSRVTRVLVGNTWLQVAPGSLERVELGTQGYWFRWREPEGGVITCRESAAQAFQLRDGGGSPEG